MFNHVTKWQSQSHVLPCPPIIIIFVYINSDTRVRGNADVPVLEEQRLVRSLNPDERRQGRGNHRYYRKLRRDNDEINGKDVHDDDNDDDTDDKREIQPELSSPVLSTEFGYDKKGLPRFVFRCALSHLLIPSHACV